MISLILSGSSSPSNGSSLITSIVRFPGYLHKGNITPFPFSKFLDCPVSVIMMVVKPGPDQHDIPLGPHLNIKWFLLHATTQGWSLQVMLTLEFIAEFNVSWDSFHNSAPHNLLHILVALCVRQGSDPIPPSRILFE